jgi:peptidoglycan/xylan/chitin deacetylase (PgdA/CDA1 family)
VQPRAVACASMGRTITGPGLRRGVKRALAAIDRAGTTAPATGATLLIYHRVGGGTPDERDLPTVEFEAQVEELTRHRVVSLGTALDELDAGDDRPKVVVTFDDGFEDVHRTAWPLLRDAGLPFTLYVTTAYLDGTMHWPGSTSQHPGPGLRWTQLEELASSSLVTIGNHTHTHARPEQLTAEELDTCTDLLDRRLGIVPDHFCFTWGVAVPAARDLLTARFRSAAVGTPGRNHPDTDRLGLARVPVRGTDPLPFFRAKLKGELTAEQRYERLVQAAKRRGLSG